MKNETKALPTKIKMLISITTLLSVLIGFNQCVLNKTGKSNSKSTSKYGSTDVPAPSNRDAGDIGADKDLPPGVDLPAMNTKPTDSELALVDVGIKNFEQINLTMSKLTGIPTNNGNVLPVYNDIVIQLPTDNNVKNFLPSMQVAITKLATEYCDRLVEVGTLQSTIWPAINVTQTPAQTLTSTNKVLLISQTIDYFFGPIDQPSIDNAKAELLSLYDSLITGESLTTNATTKKVVKGICTAALSSAYVTLF